MAINDRLRRLEDHYDEARTSRGDLAFEEALRLLSDEDLYALDDLLEETHQRGENPSGTVEDLYQAPWATARHRQGLDAYFGTLETLLAELELHTEEDDGT